MLSKVHFSKMADEKKGLIDIEVDDDDENEAEVDTFSFQDFHKDPEVHGVGTIGDTGAGSDPTTTASPATGTTIPAHSIADSDGNRLSGAKKHHQYSKGMGEYFKYFVFFFHVNGEDEGDKTELLGERKSPPFWTFEYYQGFFDVDTMQVVRRIIGSMVPSYRKNFLVSQIRPNPDLYGPFWVCATLVFTTAISGNLASYLASTGDHEWVYDFHKVTLAAGAIYTYAFLLPTALWGLLMWRRSNAGYSFLEILCVYGYSLSIYIPISILWTVPFDWLRWIFVVIGMVLSGSVLLLTFWPAVEDDDKKIAMLTMIVIFLLHGLLAIGFKLYFFHGPAELGISPTASTTLITPTAPATNTTPA